MIKGNVDLIAINEVSGWALCMDDPNNRCEVFVQLNEINLASGEAILFRPDLKNLAAGDGNCAFSFKFEPHLAKDQLKNIKVFAAAKIGGAKANKVELKIGANAVKDGGLKRSYQSFDDSNGDSN
jgi:hypothetical protein